MKYREKEIKKVIEYFSRVMIIANDLRNLGEDMIKRGINDLMYHVGKIQLHMVCAIEEPKDFNTIWIDALRNSLLCHKQKMKNGSNGEKASAASGRNKF
ncbi:LOW QUALITY PROTEIN: hypothetical protein OSB04_005584 [Centaurea solstitialis]|uniref:Uncharacterized protein n=1 Tax=Centaurea solstitialis TaxID=347529 RepID=A0AA38TI38_9ASTR|nr:LOW QUALITY PROTEIN: hypothetical protein OSB04_005584 [Centaurea solstitialis]